MAGRQNLSDFVANELKNKIMFGEYKPGDQLPNEFDIAKEYDVSRFTIREAIKKISTTGIIKIERGRGTYVNKVSPSSFMKPLLPMLMLDENDLKEICVARLAIERETAYLCALNSNDDFINELNELVKGMEDCLVNKDFEKYTELDLQYHIKIAYASKNKILCEILIMLQDLLKVEMKKGSIAPNSNQKSIECHKQIIEEFKRKNQLEAAKLMEIHINNAIDYFDKLIKSHNN
jgi:GntR family transcriptional repressor for pyruvate dehydrogenase complex